MSHTLANIVKQLDTVIQSTQQSIKEFSFNEYGGNEDNSAVTAVNSLLLNTIKRLEGPGSSHSSLARTAIEESKIHNDFTTTVLLGIIKTLRLEYSNGWLESVSELIHADVFSDYLEMASEQLEKGYKIPSAVLAGCTLEEHLRLLASRYGVPPKQQNGE